MSPPSDAGRLWGVGVGPGDPELLTVKAVRVIEAAPVIAYPSAPHGRSNARAIAAAHLSSRQIEVRLIYPVTTEGTENCGGYDAALREFYDSAAAALAAHLEAGRDVAVLCEGDPFFYGSFMYLHDRLAARFATEVVPGISSPNAATARLGAPLARRDAVLAVLPGTLSEADLVARLRASDAATIIKLGRNFAKVRRALDAAGLTDRALYVERATCSDERMIPVSQVDPASVPYFSLIIVPDRVPTETDDQVNKIAASPEGSLAVVGLGPGDAGWLAPDAARALAEATDLIGYGPYLAAVPYRAGQRRHASDNRMEDERARQALALAVEGRQVAVASSGDPGIFAMAAAIMEAMEHGPEAWRAVDFRVVPGISAMQAAAARVGAPLGHDFCVISLSDRLKPWEAIARRLEAAAAADFAIALYNPSSQSRRRQLVDALAILARHRDKSTPVVIARDVGGSAEHVTVADLGSVEPASIDMRTILLIGSSATRSFRRADGSAVVYTPRRGRA